MRAAISALRCHLWAFLAVVLFVPACAWIAIQRSTPRYTATGALIYEPTAYKVPELESILRTDPTTEAVMASQAEVLQSLKIAQEVASRGALYEKAEFNPTLRPASTLSRMTGWFRNQFDPPNEDLTQEGIYGPVAEPGRNATVAAVRDALHAAPVRMSRVLEVTFTAEDPLVAAAAVNNAMDEYIKAQFRAKAGAVRRATAWLEGRAKELRAEVGTADDRIASYRASHNISQGMHASLDAEKISHLSEDLLRARAELAAADARLDAARGGTGATAQAAIAVSVTPLRTHLEQLTVQYQAQSLRLGGSHPDAISLRRQVEEAKRSVEAEIARVVTATEQDRRAAKERVASLESNLRDGQRDADQEAKARISLSAMERDNEASRAQLLAVLERIQQTAQQHALETSEAHEISLAQPPRQPSWPRTGPIMAAASGAGVLLGLMLVHLRHLTDATLHSGEDVRGIVKLPCFALVPELSRRELRSAPIEEFVTRRPLTHFAEQIRAVRAGLWLGVDRPKVVAVTAARPAEGKSVLALSLARSAALSGERVLLIDCDLRRPSLAHRLRADNSKGLSDLLRGKAGMEDVLHADHLSSSGAGMHFVPAGNPSGDAFELFMGPQMARLLTAARREYALVVLDSPPVQAITEARVIAAVADATIMCVRWRSTPRDVVRYALDLLEDANALVAGVVLTRVDPRAHVRSGYAEAEAYHRRYKGYYSG